MLLILPRSVLLRVARRTGPDVIVHPMSKTLIWPGIERGRGRDLVVVLVCVAHVGISRSEPRVLLKSKIRRSIILMGVEIARGML